MQRQLADLGPTITSLANEKVKYARTLDRRRVRHKERRFIIEGIRLLEDALKAGCVPASVFFVPGLEDSSRAANLLREAAALTSEVYPVAPHIIESLTDTVTPQGLLAVLPFPRSSLAKTTCCWCWMASRIPATWGRCCGRRKRREWTR